MNKLLPVLLVVLVGCASQSEIQRSPRGKGALHVEQAGRSPDAAYVFCYGNDCPARTVKELDVEMFEPVAASTPATAPILIPASSPVPASAPIATPTDELSRAKAAEPAPQIPPKKKAKKKRRAPVKKKSLNC